MRKYAPATQRNRNPILKVLRRVFPARGVVLEIAAGTGEHAVWFARHLPGLIWQPSDVGSLESIEAWHEWAALPNLQAPVHLDTREKHWPLDRADALFCANLVHISSWAACRGLFAGAGHILPGGAPMAVYGPFLREETPAAPSNVAFDGDLRARNPAWGIRWLTDVEALAAGQGLELREIVEMPANNLTLVFQRKRDE